MEYGAYLLDIEGTTTPIEFVTRVLFPYAASELEAMETGLSARTFSNEDLDLLWSEFAQDTDVIQARTRWQKPADLVGACRYALELIRVDRKSTALKSIQGKIWESGYRSGHIHGEIYPDVLPAIHRWRNRGAKVAIYSSGSILAQKLLFEHLPDGDITPLLDAHFDTTTGSKKEPMSYVLIANALELATPHVLFLSDSVDEVAAAKGVGMGACLVDRCETSMVPGAIADFRTL